MNCFRLITGTALVICTINGFSAEQDSGTGDTQAEQPGGGVVIEYKEQAEDPSAVDSVKSSTASTAEGTSVELIVGGSGEDGVAKRKEMPVRK